VNSASKSDSLRAADTETVLVVDDTTNNRFLMQTYLASAGYQVDLARTGEEALERVSQSNPGIVVLDIMLPRMNGHEVCRRIKTSPRIRHIPVIMITALHGTDERILGIEAGADDFINKPINRVELLIRVKSLLRIKRLHEALAQKVNELEKVQFKLRQMAVTDGLTGLYNYRYFRSQLLLELSRSKRFGMPLSLVMMDIDHFKDYNDRFGHPSGDVLLKQFTSLVREHIRDVDVLSRYGGEEFMLILPGTDKPSARIAAEKLRVLTAETPFPMADPSQKGRVTVSAGIASAPIDAEIDETLIHLADKALYLAKNNGRNQTVTV
jgi:diguanylate cyclase (GGDEF)-like protein